MVQAFLKKWWVESDFKAPNLPLSWFNENKDIYVYICISVGDPIIKFNPATICADPTRGPGFPTPRVVVSFMFNDTRSEVIVRFVDIVEHDRLNFIFIKCVMFLLC